MQLPSARSLLIGQLSTSSSSRILSNLALRLGRAAYFLTAPNGATAIAFALGITTSRASHSKSLGSPSIATISVKSLSGVGRRWRRGCRCLRSDLSWTLLRRL